MKKIIIFGATGLVGAYTTMTLKKDGYDVIAVGRRKSDNGFFAENGIQYISLNIQNKDNFCILPQSNIYAIYHFAGAMPAHMCGYNPYEYLNSNITGTLNILEYAKVLGVKKFIFSQSVSDVLYLSGTTNPIPADSEMHHPLTGDHAVYSISKNAAVGLVRHYEVEYGITAYILRLPTIYAYHPNPYYYVNGKKKMLGYRFLMQRTEQGEPIFIWGNPNNVKEFVYIDDFIQLCECCLKSNNGGIFNAGNDFPLSFDEQVRIMVEVFSRNGKKSPILYDPKKPSSPQFILDISNAREQLGYVPTFDCRKALEAFKKEKELQRFKRMWGGCNLKNTMRPSHERNRRIYRIRALLQKAVP